VSTGGGWEAKTAKGEANYINSGGGEMRRAGLARLGGGRGQDEGAVARAGQRTCLNRSAGTEKGTGLSDM
jgi:hypothetical protein